MLIPVSGEAAQKPVPNATEDVCPVKIGAQWPVISLTTVDGTQFDLNAAIAEQPTIVLYYRGGWCPYCNMQLGQLSRIEPQLLALGYQIIAVSPDRPAELQTSTDKLDVKYALLSDSKMLPNGTKPSVIVVGHGRQWLLIPCRLRQLFLSAEVCIANHNSRDRRYGLMESLQRANEHI